MSNPLIANKDLPKFDLISSEHVEPVVDYLKKYVDNFIARIERVESISTQTFLEVFDELDFVFQQSWSPISHLTSVKNSDSLRQAYEKVLPEIIDMGLKLEQNITVFKKLESIQKSVEFSKLNPTVQRIIKKKTESAKLSGVGLEGTKKDRFNEISKRLSEISTKFSNNILDSTKEYQLIITDITRLEGLSEEFLAGASDSYNRVKKDTSSTPTEGPWCITLDTPVYIQIMKFAKDRNLREELYRARIKVASIKPYDNSQYLAEILNLRQEKSLLLGFKDYTELSLSVKMAPNAANVIEFLDQLRAGAKPLAQKEYDKVADFAKKEGLLIDKMQSWDFSYFAECYRQKNFDLNEQELRKYFPINRVLEGLWVLSEKLFGIKIVEATESVTRWHKDVRFFEIYDSKSNKKIARFYLDPYSRPEEKRGGAWMNSCVDRWIKADETYLPCAYLICNSSAPVGGKPSTMNFDEVTTLFHEFGHGLQHMLTSVDYPYLAGINGVEWDVVELPSQFMENWCYDRSTLNKLSSHIDTHQPIPDDLYQKMLLDRYFLEPTQTLRQVSFALTDMILHMQPRKFKEPMDVYHQVAKETLIHQPLPEDKFLCSFSHIFAGGYAAGYYSYKWAEVLSADAFSRFEEANLNDQTAMQKIGMDFRNTVLSLGGSQDPMDVFVKFRGRKPDPMILLKNLK